jgi:hypothetical protein
MHARRPELMRARHDRERAALAAKSAKKAQVVAIEEALEQMQREFEHEKQPLGGDRSSICGSRRPPATARWWPW